MSWNLSRLACAAMALAACAQPAAAGKLNATPGDLDQVLSRAHGGDTVVLAAGQYREVELKKREFKPALVIDARAADITGIAFNQVKGVTIQGGSYHLPPTVENPKTGRRAEGVAMRFDKAENIKMTGGTFLGPGGSDDPEVFGEGYGFMLLGGADVEVDGNHFRGFKSGLVLSKVDGFRLTRNDFSAMRSDGLQVAESRNGLIEGNQCSATHVRDKEHPDCIQMWSRPTSPPTADIVIRRNKMEGNTQGIGLFNHTRNGVDDGGFDRITIEDNDVNVGYPQAIAIYEGRGSVVRNNRVSTYQGARWQARITTTPEVRRCGNRQAAGADRSGVVDDPC